MQHTLTICNVATRAMVRECALSYITRAGVEIGVGATTWFTTHLQALILLALLLGQSRVHARAGTYERHLSDTPH